MSHAVQTQETASGDSYRETSEWKVPYGILLLKSTFKPGFGLKTVELGVITEEEVVEGKKVYKFCRLADLFYTSTRRIPDSRVEIKNLLDDTLDKTGRYSKSDGSRTEYKYLYSQDDMIEFVRKLGKDNCYRLAAILTNETHILKINEQNKQLLAKSLEIVINETPARNHNQRH